MAWAFNSIEIPKPDKFDINFVEIADYARDISGRLYKTIVAKVRKFSIQYTGVDVDTASKLQSFADEKDYVYFTYEYDGVPQALKVSITQATIKRVEASKELYSVSMTMEEALE